MPKLKQSIPSVQINTEKPYYFSGEYIRGNISLSVRKPTAIKTIVLELTGEEHARVTGIATTTDSVGRQKTTTKVYEESRTFFRNSRSILYLTTNLAPGEFIFPFEFQLNPHHPGTAILPSGSGSINYKFTAYIKGERKNSKIEVSHSLPVYRPLEANKLFPSTISNESNLTFCCCYPRGKVTLVSTLDRSAYALSDTILLHILIDNSTSKVDLRAIKLKLVLDHGAIAQGHSEDDRVTLSKVQSPGVSAGERVERYIQLVVPTNIYPSTSGSLVRVNYLIVAELDVPWSKNVDTTREVTLYMPVLPVTTGFTADQANYYPPPSQEQPPPYPSSDDDLW